MTRMQMVARWWRMFLEWSDPNGPQPFCSPGMERTLAAIVEEGRAARRERRAQFLRSLGAQMFSHACVAALLGLALAGAGFMARQSDAGQVVLGAVSGQ